jgi:hypothetical protein
MKLRIYTDTSVLGGCEDEEFAEDSVRLLESFIRGGVSSSYPALRFKSWRAHHLRFAGDSPPCQRHTLRRFNLTARQWNLQRPTLPLAC